MSSWSRYPSALLACTFLLLDCADKSQLVTAHTASGDEALAGGSYAGAVAAYRNALKLNPKRPAVHLNLARALNGLHRYPEAIEALRSSLSLDPGLGAAHLLLGQTLTASGEYVAALGAFERAEQLLQGAFQPAHSTVIAQLGVAGFLAKPPPPVLPPQQLKPYLNQKLLWERDLPDSTATRIRALLASDPSAQGLRPLRHFLARWHMVSAVAKRQRGDFAGAVKAYKRAAFLSPSVLTQEGPLQTGYGYDQDGNLSLLVNAAGDSTRYTYDAADRLTRIDYAGEQVGFEYTASSKLFRITDPTGSTVSTYDEADRPAGTKFPNGQKLRFAHDGAGYLSRMIYPDRQQVEYEYAASGAISRITAAAGVTEFSYNRAGDLELWKRANGLETGYAYDDAGRVVGVTHTRYGDVVLAFHYKLDGSGRPVERRQIGGGGSVTTRFRYDAAGRLLEELGANGYQARYSYDLAGNRLQRIVGADTTDYLYGRDNRLLIAEDEVFNYDRNGNVVARLDSAGITRYAYDGAGRLVKIYGGGRAVEFHYRGDGIRWAKVIGGQPQYVLTDPDDQVVMRVDDRGRTTNTFTYGPMLLGEQGLHYLYDYPGGSVVAATDGGGRLVSTVNYDAFGVALPSPSAGRTHHTFRGGVDETDTGLIYLGGRYYDPDLGRFLTPQADSTPNLVRPQNEYAELGFIIGSHNSNPNLAAAMEWAAAADAVAKAVGDVLNGGYRLPLEIAVHVPTAITPSLLLRDPRLPPLLSAAPVRLWAEQILHPGRQRFSIQVPGATQPPAPLLQTAAALVADQIERRWRRQPGRVQQPGRAYDAGAGFAGPAGDFSEVRIEEVAGRLRSYFGEITRITSVLFDEARGQLIFVGDAQAGQPPLILDDFVVALRATYVLKQDPAVSIGTEASGIADYKKVRYDGGTANTSFGQTMFAADYALKTLSIGRDSTRTPVSLDLDGFKSVVEWTVELDELVLGMLWNSRVWFVPGHVDIRKRQDGRGILVGDIPVVVLSESRFYHRSLRQQGVETFASFLTKNYDALGARYPAVAKLAQLAQLVAVAKWMRDHRIPIDAAWVEDYPLSWVITPTMVRAATARRDATGPTGAVTFEMEGGVSFREPNDYGVDDAKVEAVEAQVLASRPVGAGAAAWSFSVGQEAKRAVALPTRRSRRDGVLRFSQTDISGDGPGTPALLRFYSSFQRRAGPFGQGWSALPFALLFRRELIGAPGESAEPDVGDEAIVLDRSSGRSQGYEIVSEFAPDADRRTLRLNMDGTLSWMGAGGVRVDFGKDGRLVAIVERGGQVVRFVYAGQRLQSIEGEGGRIVELTYDDADRVVAATDRRGRRVTYTYDVRGDLTLVTDAAGREISYAYDQHHRLVKWDWGNAATMQARYDGAGRVLEFVDATGAASQFGYDQVGRTTVVDQLGNTHVSHYDADLRTRSRDDAGAGGIAATYTSVGELASIASASGDRVDFSYDHRGNLVEVRDPLGGRFRFAYGPDGLHSIQGPGGADREFEYDDPGNLIAVSRGQGASTKLDYDPSGALTGYGEGRGMVRFERDNWGAIVRVVGPDGGAVTVESDSGSVAGSPSAGDRISALRDDAHRKIAFFHDAAERLIRIESAAGALAYDYDHSGRLGSIRGPDGALTTIRYEAGQPTAIEYGDGGRTEFEYGADGRLRSVDGPEGRRLRYEYDEAGQFVRLISEEVR